MEKSNTLRLAIRTEVLRLNLEFGDLKAVTSSSTANKFNQARFVPHIADLKEALNQ